MRKQYISITENLDMKNGEASKTQGYHIDDHLKTKLFEDYKEALKKPENDKTTPYKDINHINTTAEDF
jgi:hypothetical protein